MRAGHIILLSLLFWQMAVVAQIRPGSSTNTSCGQKEITERLYQQYPALRQFQTQSEKILTAYNRKLAAGEIAPNSTNAVVTLPVVVHIIHNNGPENISDAQVFTAIQHLNEAFANTGYYDPADGVNTQIQFCLAQRDPNNLPTNGIDRIVSPLTVMNGWVDGSQDMAVKNLSRWDPRCYVNIWLVREITGPVAGYAYLPSAHGLNMDGIVGEANYFGSSYANDVLIIHEMGHYLGLYHTFQGGCTNNDCSKDGDQVCDTPPDQSTAGISCNSTANSCSTDALSGFSTDVNDLHTDYLDYGNWNCMKVFTQGQANRMNWFIQNVRSSLLACKSCMPPCPTPVVTNFSPGSLSISMGTTVNFTNASINADGYRWYINNQLQSTATDFSYTFNTAGTYIIKLTGYSNNVLCDSTSKLDTIIVSCPVNAGFSPSTGTFSPGQTVNFINSSSGATSYQWSVNGTVLSAATNFTYNFASPGFYAIRLLAYNGICNDSSLAYFSIADTTSAPLDSCGRSTFQKTYAATGSLEITSISSTSDGGTLFSGYSGTPVQKEAVMVRVTANGNPQWAIAMKGNTGSEFTRVRQTHDGGYIGVAQADNADPDPNYILLVRLNAAGTVLWTQHYGAESGTVWADDVIELNNGNFVIAGKNELGANNVHGLVMVIGSTGNVIWARKYRHQLETHFQSVIAIGDTLVLAGSTYNGSRYTGTVLKMSEANGNIYASISFQSTVKGNHINKISKQGYGYFISTLEMDYNNPVGKQNSVLRLKDNLDVLDYYRKGETDESIYSVSAATHDSGYIIPTSYTAGMLLMTAGPGINNIWGNRYGGTLGPTKSINVLALNNGQYVTGASYDISAGRRGFLLVKTNRAGVTPGCNDNPPTQSTGMQLINSGRLQWQEISPFFERPKRPLNLQAEPVVVTAGNLCFDCDSTIITADTCGNTTFQEIIRGAGEETVTDIKVLADGSYLLTGSTTTSIGGISQRSAALYMNVLKNGQINWQKKITGTSNEIFTKILLTSAGDKIIFGKTQSQHNINGSMLVTKIDGSGNIIWAREHDFRNASYTGFISVDDAIELPNGEFAFCASVNGINTDVGQPMAAGFNLVGVLRNDGTLRWFRRYREYYTESGGSSLAIVHLNNWLFVSTSYGIMKLAVADGTPTGLNKKFLYIGGFLTLEAAGNNILASSGRARTLFDQNLQVLSSWQIVNPDNNLQLLAGGWSAENATTAMGSMMKLPSKTEKGLFISKITDLNKRQWAYKYPYSENNTTRYLERARLTSDKGFVLSGYSYREPQDRPREQRDIMLVRTDSMGNIFDCPRASASYQFVEQKDHSFLELHARTYPLSVTSYTLNLQPENAQLVVEKLCASQNCDLISMMDKDTVCSLRDTLTIRLTRSKDCDAFTEWIVDSTAASVVSFNDSTISLLFRTRGEFWIKARIAGPCRLMQDSIAVTVFDAPDSLNLGPDIQLCRISTYTIKAGSGFLTYQWNDGSTDSTLTIFQPGIYSVTATDYCGNKYRDTVVVSQAPDLIFDLGPDRETCLYDTISITAPAGFIKYYWSPDHNVNSRYTGSLRAWPVRDTTYIVIAEKSPGCLVTDSIRIKVNEPLPVYVGADTSICAGEAVSLQATPGFSSYLWSTGGTGLTTTVQSKGLYHVRATDARGCVARDTMEVVNVFELPRLSLGNDLSLCEGKTIEFDAGIFNNYVWNNGSHERTLRADRTGSYWVRVTDMNGCSNADTVSILTILPSPSNFLAAEAEICVGQRLELKAATGYRSYRWFNNASSSAVTVTAPGIYWLEVTNAEGCTSRDSIFVKAKDCLKGVFFPNAFTPFNGGVNNSFRPIVYGPLESFHLVVFNRYGQKVFETRDANRGWDGRVNGNAQGTNSFTWSAVYRFAGDAKSKNEKGTVTLVR